MQIVNNLKANANISAIKLLSLRKLAASRNIVCTGTLGSILERPGKKARHVVKSRKAVLFAYS